jgi:ribosomal protein L22
LGLENCTITKRNQAEQGDAAQADDQVRFQPVLAVAFFQKYLQAAQAHAEGDDPA